MRQIDLESVAFDSNGLVPVICQHAETKKVLMLGYANQETLEETAELGKMVFYSRSRATRWLKGETSGNFLKVVSLHSDCDLDAVLALVLPDGPTCHNGTESCFGENQ